MICLIAGNALEAEQWASGQNLHPNEWFYPRDEEDLKQRCNFHVIVVGTAGQNTPLSFFNRIYNLALTRGRIGRG